ncbi:MAG TPA: FtsX-like permease family protein [Stellaceae bacterium]
MATLPLSWRLARRELRGGLRGFRIFLACLALGVAVIAGVGSLSAAVSAGLHADARAMLGGDVELHLVHRTATPQQRAYLAKEADVSEVAQMRAMARTETGDERTLIELKAVDRAYPLYGDVTLDPPQSLAAATAERDGHWGAAVAPGLLTRLKLHLGDSIQIGDATFVLRAVVTHEPDAATGGFEFGPRVMVAAPALAETGLLAPGALVGYSYRLRLPPNADIPAWVAAVKRAFPTAGWRIREFGNAAPSIERLVGRVTVFMTLVGLTALLVGGIGVGNAVRGYIGGKTATIATLKCLGAPGRLVFTTYLAQILTLAAGGILIGVVLGALTPLLATPLISSFPITTRVSLYPAPLLFAAVFGLLTTLAFALWPLAAARDVPAASLFRDLVDPAPRWPRPGYVLATAASALALAGLGIVTATDRVTAAWFIAGAAGALIAFHLVALGIVALARRAGRPRAPRLRLALANLYRPGAPTAGIVASLGIGLTVLVAIALIERNVDNTIDERLPEHSPSYFFIDIQPDQVAEFDKLIAATPGVSQVERVASLRGRITEINGVPVEKAVVAPEAQWTIQSERGLTYATSVPRGSRVVAGEWWPKDYHGPPLVSMDAEIARGMSLKIGDTITVNVLGRDVTATIANLREIDWTSLGINFVLVFSPGMLEAAPQTHIATARTPPGEEAALERAVTDRFPNVSAIAVKDALAALSQIVTAIATALRATAAITLAAGTLVLAGAVAAGQRRRVYEAVVLKVLGATRNDITRAFLIEYGILGLATAALAAALGTLAAYLVLTRIMHQDWTFLPGALVSTALIATALTLGIGYAGTWKALGAKAAPFLRNE